MIDAKSVDADALFRVFTACPNDPKVCTLRGLLWLKHRGHALPQPLCARAAPPQGIQTLPNQGYKLLRPKE